MDSVIRHIPQRPQQRAVREHRQRRLRLSRIAARTIQGHTDRPAPLHQPQGMVQVGLQRRPLTASAALVWSGDLPRPLQQMLFDTADSLTESAHPQLANLNSLTTA